MPMDYLRELVIDELISSPLGQKLCKAMDTFATVQRNISALKNSEDNDRVNLLKIGTVFQIFLVDILASGKKPNEFTQEDWLAIAQKVSQYAIIEEGQCYSEFVFTLYANYIIISADNLPEFVAEERRDAIKELAESIRYNTEQLNKERIKEVTYVEGCLWISLEAMVKLFSTSMACVFGPELAMLTQAATQLAFEYGRYVLFAKERAILEEYIQKQYILDEELKEKYDSFLKELQKNAERFQGLIDNAFSSSIHESLVQSVALARAVGVPEEELLATAEEIDEYFLS